MKDFSHSVSHCHWFSSSDCRCGCYKRVCMTYSQSHQSMSPITRMFRGLILNILMIKNSLENKQRLEGTGAVSITQFWSLPSLLSQLAENSDVSDNSMHNFAPLPSLYSHPLSRLALNSLFAKSKVS